MAYMKKRNGKQTCISIVFLQSTDLSKHLKTLVTFTHSQTHSYTDGIHGADLLIRRESVSFQSASWNFCAQLFPHNLTPIDTDIYIYFTHTFFQLSHLGFSIMSRDSWNHDPPFPVPLVDDPLHRQSCCCLNVTKATEITHYLKSTQYILEQTVFVMIYNHCRILKQHCCPSFSGVSCHQMPARRRSSTPSVCPQVLVLPVSSKPPSTAPWTSWPRPSTPAPITPRLWLLATLTPCVWTPSPRGSPSPTLYPRLPHQHPRMTLTLALRMDSGTSLLLLRPQSMVSLSNKADKPLSYMQPT